MNAADLHLRYDRERRGDLIRRARMHELAARVGASRARERQTARMDRRTRLAHRSPLA